MPLALNTASNTASFKYPRLRRFAIDLTITIFFNVICAVFVTYALRVHDVFFVNLVISMCIGTLAVTFIDGGRLLLWGDKKPPTLPFILLLIVAIPAAMRLGSMSAIYLLDIPPQNFQAVRARNATGLIAVAVLACLSMTWFFWTQSRLQQMKAEAEAEKARAAAIEKQALQAQLRLLQAQIEPHMLFNTLANLQGLIGIDTTRAQHLLDQLIQYLRATLTSSRAEKTTLAQEFALMEAYLGLMSLRMGPRLSYTLQLPEVLCTLSVPPMLLQPLVENAVKHGLEPKIDGGRIDVQANRQDETLTLTVTDTGLGLDASAGTTNGTKVGVANVRERLQALYGDRASFSLTPNTPTGVIARLTIPL
jgi:signal transduction histidine kinase